jgi:hypothetical protein
MEIKSILKPALPHVIAILVFIVISFAYFYPVLEGKVLKANDSTVSKINSKEIQDYREKYGKEPLWTNSIFGGMPAYLISTKYPGNLVKKVDTFLRMFQMPVSVLFLSLTGFYILMIIFGASPWLAGAGAVAFSFSSFFFQILGAGHNTQAIALAYMAPMIGAIYFSYRYDLIKGALFTSLILALEIQANHPQITYYAFLCLMVFGIVELIYAVKDKTVVKFLKTTGVLIIPFLIAIGINFASLYTTYEYGKYSIRGKSDLTINNTNSTPGLDKEYITHWSYGVDETFNLLIPNYKGGSSKPFDRTSETVKALHANNARPEAASQMQKYWGTQPGTDGPHYAGAIVFFLFVLGLIIIKGPEKWWLLAATILSVMLAWGKNFMPLSNLFIDYFPGYNKFRAVTMILVIAEFCIPLLGFLALRDIFNGTVTGKELKKSLLIAAGITGGFLLLALVIPGIAGSFIGSYETEYPDWLKTSLIADRKELLRSDALRSLVFVLLSAGVIFGFLSGKLKKELSVILIGGLILVDLWSVDKRYLDADRFENTSTMQKSFVPSIADAYILQDPSQIRVLNFTNPGSTFNDNSPTSYFHKSIGGYHGAKMERYQELIDTSLYKDLTLIEIVRRKAQTLEDWQAAFKGTNAINMLNTKYVIYNPDAAPLINPNALGNAWFVEKPLIAENANQEISAINNIDPSKEAVLDIKFKSQVTKSSYPVGPDEKIELVSYKADELVYKASAKEEKLAVFSEIYYPAGWKCYIDGKESQYFRTDYILRGMIIPAGDHEIRFSFKPNSYITGNKISLISSITLILMFLAYIVYDRLFKPKNA